MLERSDARPFAETAAVVADEQLLRAFLAGDPAAVKLVHKWILEVIRFNYDAALRGEAEDIIQMTILCLLRACRQSDFTLRIGLRPLVKRIATVRCIDLLRRRRHQVEVPETIPDTAPSIADRVELAEAREALRRAIGTLSAAEQDLIREYYFESASCGEIARRRGKQPSTVAFNLFKTRGKLRLALGRYGVT